MHSGNKHYSCDTCGKALSQFSSLAKHLRVHSGDKPYSCDTCGRTLSQSGSLAKHIHTHKDAL